MHRDTLLLPQESLPQDREYLPADPVPLEPGQPLEVDTSRSVYPPEAVEQMIGFAAPVPAAFKPGFKGELIVVDVRDYPVREDGYRYLPNKRVRADFMVISPLEWQESRGKAGYIGIREKPVEFGRSNPKAESRFSGMSTVSGHHASFARTPDGGLIIEDLGSTNKTTVRAHEAPKANHERPIQPAGILTGVVEVVPATNEHYVAPEQLDSFSAAVSTRIKNLSDNWNKLTPAEASLVSETAGLGASLMIDAIGRGAKLPPMTGWFKDRMDAIRRSAPWGEWDQSPGASPTDREAFGHYEFSTMRLLERITASDLNLAAHPDQRPRAEDIAMNILPAYAAVIAYNNERTRAHGQGVLISANQSYVQEKLGRINKAYKLASEDGAI